MLTPKMQPSIKLNTVVFGLIWIKMWRKRQAGSGLDLMVTFVHEPAEESSQHNSTTAHRAKVQLSLVELGIWKSIDLLRERHWSQEFSAMIA